MQASITEPAKLAERLGLARKSWGSVRPVTVAVVYLGLYAGLKWVTQLYATAPQVSLWHIPAGLHFALLVTYGIGYAPLVLAAILAANLGLYPLPLTSFETLWYSAGLTLVYVGGAALVRRKTSGPVVNLRLRSELAKLLLAGLLVSVLLATVSSLSMVLAGLIAWKGLLPAVFSSSISNATGVLLLAPFLLVHAVPRLEAWVQHSAGVGQPARQEHQSLRTPRPALLAAIVSLALTTLVLWLVFWLGVSSDLSVFFLFSLPLILLGLRRGLAGVTMAVLVLMGGVMALLWRQGAAIDQMLKFQILLLTASLNALFVGSCVTEIENAGDLMDRRDTILEAVSFAAESFLGKAGWEVGIHEVLHRLGQAVGVSRVYIVDNRFTETSNDAPAAPLHEWTAVGMSRELADLQLLNLLRGQLIEQNSQSLSRGQPCLVRTREIPLKKREILEALDIRSMIIVPMFVERQWWGCLGLEQCYLERDWPASDLEGLKMAGQILGTLLASVRVEQQFRQLTGNVQAVFWISSPDGERKNYVSPAYEEIWGRSCASLHREPGSWLEAIHPEDHQRVKEALVKQAWGEYDEEYRVIRPDSSVRWVRDRAFPVRDQAGHVYRIAGIAEDTTKHKKVEQQLRATTVLFSSLIDNLQPGILVEDESRRIIHVNQAFSSMFAIRVPTRSMFDVDSRLLFSRPQSFADHIEEIIAQRTPVLGEELHFQDRILHRSYIPLSVGEEYRYHLWQYVDVTDSRRAEEQIKASLNEKDVLLKEIHHRVKNNLQIISSLLSLQAQKIDNPMALQIFRESQDRVKAMALIHERLYQSGDLARIDFAGYVRNLTSQLLRSYKVNTSLIRLNLEVDPLTMNFDLAIPCALIIHELVSNALKYAFGGERAGQIWVRFREDVNEQLRLSVKDDGIGLPQQTDFEHSGSLGLKLVRSLADQVDGKLTYQNNGGFQCEISIPRSKARFSINREQTPNGEQALANLGS